MKRMSTTLTLLAIGVVAGLVYGLRRSNTRKNRLLSAAARREKHAPKAVEVPTSIASSSRQDKPSEQSQEKSENAAPVQKNEEVIVESSSRQVDELSSKEREEYDLRDRARDENIQSLRLIIQDLFDDDFGNEGIENTNSEEQAGAPSIESRNQWIQQNEQPLNEHASFVEQEKIGSGIKVIQATEKENADMEQRLKREGAKSGEVQISLAWDDFNDLDLHMFCPSGERIYFNNRTSECGGELDVDMNVRPTSDNAVENIVWINDAPLGQYKVGVHFYKHHNRDQTTPKCAFRLRLTIHGEVRNYSGNITHGQAMQMVTSFTLNDKKNSLNQ